MFRSRPRGRSVSLSVAAADRVGGGGGQGAAGCTTHHGGPDNRARAVSASVNIPAALRAF